MEWLRFKWSNSPDVREVEHDSKVGILLYYRYVRDAQQRSCELKGSTVVPENWDLRKYQFPELSARLEPGGYVA